MKKILNIIFELIIIILLYLSIIINTDYSVLNKRCLINNKKTLDKYSSYKYVSINSKNIEETRFMYNNNNIIYVINIENKSILVELTKNTIIIDKLDLMYMNDNTNTYTLKNDLNEENNNKYDFIKGYYTNKNLRKNERLVKIKYNITTSFISFLGVICLINILCLFLKKN